MSNKPKTQKDKTKSKAKRKSFTVCDRCKKRRNPEKLRNGSYGYKKLCWSCFKCIEKGVGTNAKDPINHKLGDF